jgi:pimeloyl-ACP methyl ester carboxylesterase
MSITMTAIALVLAAAPLAAVAAPKPTIVLVHGAFETSEVWGHVVGKLEHDGYTVRNVDLPGRRGAELPMGEVSMALYQQTVAKVIAAEKHPVVLVGHSFGGFVISAAAEAQPERIKTLVYVAAYIPQSGQSLLTLATTDKDSKLGGVLTIAKDQGYAAIDPTAGAAVFANDAPASVQEVVAGAIVKEPLAPLATPVTLTAGRFGSVDRVAILTLRDEAVSPALQNQMVLATPVRLQMTIDTGHTPFITQPDTLAAQIEKAAQ